MQMSDYGRSCLKLFEGEKLVAYRDGGGVLTIGVGHTAGVHEGQTITQAESDELLRDDIATREDRLSRILAGHPTTQRQFDALMCLVFNIGFGDPSRNIPGLLTSTVLKRHLLGNFMGAANAFGMWCKDNGRIVPGLVRRREQEREIYLSGDV